MISKSKLYKELPDGWVIKPLPDCIEKASISRDIKIPQSDYAKHGKYPIIDQGADFIAGFTDDDSKLYTSDLPVIVFGDHTRIFKYVDFPFSLGADGTKLLRPRDFLDPKYFYFYLWQLPLESKGYNRHYKYLKEKSIIFPEKTEQQKIALVLSKIQQAIEQQEKVIMKTKELKRSLMHRIFTYGLRGEELKETEIGLMPKSWDVVKLGSIFKIQQGKQLSSKFQKGISPYLFLRTANVFWGRIDISHIDSMDFSPEEVEKLTLKKDDLLVCEGGDIGRTAIWDGQLSTCLYQNHLHRLRPLAEDILPRFYMYWMQVAFLYFRLYEGIGNKTTIPNLSASRLSLFLLPKPSFSEQKEISSILLSIDKKISQAESRKQTLQSLFKSMLNLLMTGQVRVKDVDFGENCE